MNCHYNETTWNSRIRTGAGPAKLHELRYDVPTGVNVAASYSGSTLYVH